MLFGLVVFPSAPRKPTDLDSVLLRLLLEAEGYEGPRALVEDGGLGSCDWSFDECLVSLLRDSAGRGMLGADR